MRGVGFSMGIDGSRTARMDPDGLNVSDWAQMTPRGRLDLSDWGWITHNAAMILIHNPNHSKGARGGSTKIRVYSVAAPRSRASSIPHSDTHTELSTLWRLGRLLGLGTGLGGAGWGRKKQECRRQPTGFLLR